MKKLRPLIPLAVIFALLGWWLWSEYQSEHPGPMIVSGTIEADDVALGSKIGGRVIEVLAEEGDRVQAGQVLVRLDRERLQAQRALAEAQLWEARAALEELEHGSRPEDIAEAQAAVAERRAVLERLTAGNRSEEIERARSEWEARVADRSTAQVTYDRLRRMASEDVVSEQRLDEARGALEATTAQAEAAHQAYEEVLSGARVEDIEQARAALDATEAAHQRTVAGPRSEEIERARARVAQVEAEIAGIDVDLIETEIAAPTEAIVEVLSLEPGDLIAAQRTLVTLIVPDSLYVRVYVPEDRLGWVSLGQAVEVGVDSWPNETFTGTVEQINRRAEFYPRNVQTVEERVQQVFGVKVRLEGLGERLRAGMAADVTFPEPSQ